MNFGFVIDNRKCIGCHACSTACKSENEVPLGVNRTWVKYVEQGSFPDTRRHFQVTRCNHCANPPCTYICPTTAMYQRPDGIVEFDGDRCIGCKACMQACPYDAIYIDPETGTAAKCHYCAHRTEKGLEPACVVVCPEHAILAGDLDDPASEIAQAVAQHPVRVRKPEQGTRPKTYYIEGHPASLVPLASIQMPDLLWAQRPSGGDWRGPINIEPGKMAAALMQGQPRETYAPGHRVPWHWPVPAYLVTKAIGAGVFMVSAVGVAFGWLVPLPAFTHIAALTSLIFIALTTVLLVADLDRPERFWTILTRPQWRSWLTRGAFILISFSVVAGLYWLTYVLGYAGGGNRWLALFARWLAWPGVVLAALSAIYTAFLFGQAEGRDLWQSKRLSLHLLVQAIQAGAATVLFLSPADHPEGYLTFTGYRSISTLVTSLAVSLTANLILTASEHGARHSTAEGEAAASLMHRGRYAPWYWGGVLGGLVLPLILTLAAPGNDPYPFLYVAAGLSLAGLFAYEWAFVMAPQQVPNS
jgi:Fe-S-cluster-containing dehydrogenase component/formate-dependent nitrite reductase membrane component NrfD